MRAAVLAFLVGAAVLAVPGAVAVAADPVNLGVAAEASPLGGFAFLVHEDEEGGTDLTGDGDATDVVVHFFRDGVAVNTGLAVDSAGFGALRVASTDVTAGFAASEVATGADLDGNGVIGWDIVHLVVEGVVVNTGLTSGPEIDLFVAAFDDTLAFTACEYCQGDDVNGDGVIGGYVLHTYTPATGIVNHGVYVGGATEGILSTFTPGSGNSFGFGVRETGADLNGDADTADVVAHFYSPGSGLVNLGLAMDAVSASGRSGSGFAWNVPEADQGGTDLDGDGSADDIVLHAYAPGTGVVNTMVSGIVRFLDAAGDGFGFYAWELADDLNGDGDTNDRVAHVYQPGAGVTNLGLALRADPPGCCGLTGTFDNEPLGDGLLFVADEYGQGTDLNGDADTDDSVVHYWTASSVANLEMAYDVGSPQLMVESQGMVAFDADEFDQGVDLDGDGTIGGGVLQVFDGTSLVNTATQTATARAYQDGFATGVFEDGVDIDGNGELFDVVAATWTPAAGLTIIRLPYAYQTGLPNLLLIGVVEYPDDLNGDGDAFDRVMHALVPAACNGKAVTVDLRAGDVPTAGSDVIRGTGAAETIDGGGGDDTICALAGSDVIIGGPGDDWIDGGPGADLVDYTGAPAAVAVNLQLKRATGGHGTDHLEKIEHIIGSPFDDTLRGNAKRNVIAGGDGDDGIQGLGGHDELLGQLGDDNLFGRRGDDLIDGGPGTDQASFIHAPGPATVDLRLIGPQPTGDGTDTLIGIENLFGSRFGDTLTGNGQANTIKGSKGGDSLFGRGGDDLLIGNQGIDTANGGGGTDTCRTETRIACE